MVKGAHGALTDACTVVVPGVLDGDIAPAIRQLTRERDEAREKLAKVLALHFPSGTPLNYCKRCVEPWPCITVRDFEGE